MQGHSSMVLDYLGNHPAIMGNIYIGGEIPWNGN